MKRRNFIKNTLLLSVLPQELIWGKESKKEQKNNFIGKWNIKELDFLLKGFIPGEFYMICFTNRINETEYRRIHSVDGKYFNKDIYFYCNDFIKHFSNSLLSLNKEIKFLNYSDHVIPNPNDMKRDYTNYNDKNPLYTSKLSQFIKNNKNAPVVYIFDHCEKQWYEPYEFRYIYRDLGHIDMYIIHFSFKDFWCKVVNEKYLPYLIMDVNICTSDNMGFKTEIKYNIFEKNIE